MHCISASALADTLSFSAAYLLRRAYAYQSTRIHGIDASGLRDWRGKGLVAIVERTLNFDNKQLLFYCVSNGPELQDFIGGLAQLHGAFRKSTFILIYIVLR
jgi:hypothetical protein